MWRSMTSVDELYLSGGGGGDGGGGVSNVPGSVKGAPLWVMSSDVDVLTYSSSDWCGQAGVEASAVAGGSCAAGAFSVKVHPPCEYVDSKLQKCCKYNCMT